MQIKTTMRYHLTPIRIAIIKKPTNSKCWRECGEKRTLLHCWWGCTLVQSLWRTLSVQLNRSVMSDSLWPHELKQNGLPCPSAIPGAYWDSCPPSRWCHTTFSSSVIAFSSCRQSCPASWSFPVSQFFASGGQSIGGSPSVFPMNIQNWFLLWLTGLIPLQSKGLSSIFSNSTVQKHQFFST